ncbi:hypothetical protein BGZ73_000791, partial [Actinomortierella ambigua]
MPDDALDNNALRELVLQLQDRIQYLEAGNSEQEGKVAYKHTRATTLKPYPELVDAYPAIEEQDIFNSELPKDHG